MAEQGTQQQKQEQPAATMTEAGFSMNVKLIDKFGGEVMLTFRAPLVNQAEKLLGHYENVVQHLLDGGWRVSNGASDRLATKGATSDGGGTPQCRVHNAPMRESKNRPGTYYCSKKDGNGEYCKEKA